MLTELVTAFSVPDMSTDRVEVAGEYLTRQQVADRLQVSVRTVDRYISDGVLAAKKLPGDRLVRISSESLQDLLDGAAS